MSRFPFLTTVVNRTQIFLLPIVLVAVVANVARGDVVVTESFSYPAQSDTSGFNDGGQIIYRITSTGSYGGANPLIASFAEGFQSGAGLVDESGNSVAFFDTSQQLGIGGGQHFLGIVDVPGFADSPPGGPFGNFFSVPRNLNSASGSVDVRLAGGSNASFFRLLAIDATDNEIATDLFALTGSFQTFGYTASDFVNQVTGSDFFAGQVTSVAIEFFANGDGSGNLDALQFRVDNFVLSVPEPSVLFGVLLVLAVGFLNAPCHRWSRRQLS